MRPAPSVRLLIGVAILALPGVASAGSIPERGACRSRGYRCGRLRSASTGLGTFVKAPQGIGVAATARAAGAPTGGRAFLDRYGAAFGVAGANATRVLRRSGVDAVGMEHLRVQQQVGGVPVAGGEMTIHLRGGEVAAVLARTVGDLDGLDTTPTLSGEDAEAAVRVLAAGWDDGISAVFATPRLELFNRALLTGAGSASTQLAWFVEARTDTRQQYTWVDADSGDILYSFNQRPTALVRQVWDANNAPGAYGTLLRSEGDPPTGNVQVDRVYDYAGDTYNYYASEHGRDSYDDAGATLINIVRACPNDLCFGLCPCPNAFNAGVLVYLGDNWTTDDIVAHEWTHSVTGLTAGLLYQKQSGGLNESFSDIFGETVDLENGAGNDSPAVRWRVAEDLNGSGIRDMYNPNTFGDPGRVGDGFVYCGTFDNGGVHTNSGIPNHAYALMVDGGFYNGFTVAGIGLAKADRIEYRALAHYLVASATMADDANALNQSCYDLIGTFGITIGDCNEVGKAVDAVEMDAPWPCPTDPPTPTPTVTATATITPTATDTPTPELACPAAPRSGCRTAGTAKLLWKQKGGAGDGLIFKWVRGQSTSLAELANPVATAEYALCVYSAGALLAELEVPPHATRWLRLGKGYSYKDDTGSAAGIGRIVLKSSANDSAKILFKGGGTGLPDPTLGALAAPLQVQSPTSADLCWGATFAGRI
ncbi:MAG: M4 family metallopeptidase [Candidatus Binatia bacterium]